MTQNWSLSLGSVSWEISKALTRCPIQCPTRELFLALNIANCGPLIQNEAEAKI